MGGSAAALHLRIMKTESLGQRLRRVRATIGLSLRDVASEIEGVTHSTLGRIENGSETSYKLGTRLSKWLKDNDPEEE